MAQIDDSNKPNAMFGNQFWKARSSHGRNPKFDDPKKLLSAIEEYFEHASNDYLEESKPHTHEGKAFHSETKKMVPFTEGRLCIFIGISDSTWLRYKSDTKFKDVCDWAVSVCKEQKFAGAASGFFNTNIISRDLGLADKQELTGKDGADLMPADEAGRRIAFLLAKAMNAQKSKQDNNPSEDHTDAD